jgi:cation transport ATPase
MQDNVGASLVPQLADHTETYDHATDADHERHEHGAIEMLDLIRIVVTPLRLLWSGFVHGSSFSHQLDQQSGILLGGYPIFREAFENIRERRMTMGLSMTVALLAAVCIGEFFTALIITCLYFIAEVLEGLTVGRGRRAIGDLLELLPHSAWIVKNGVTVEVGFRTCTQEIKF